MRLFQYLMILCLISGCATATTEVTAKAIEETDLQEDDIHSLVLSNQNVSFDGESVKEYNYTWHVDREHEDSYYTGEEPGDDAVYIAHDIIYYPEIDEDSFVIENYDGEQEWVCYYTNEELEEYRFSTLPFLGDKLPVEMMHSEQEAYDNPVLHITEAGTYKLSGKWNGQIWIDLGDDAFDDPNAKVTLILDGVEVTCGVAPAIVFHNVYEADNLWEERETYDNVVDLSDAGAKIVLVDGTENSFTGTNVFRLLKPVYKKNSTSVQKKRYKMDGAFYSYQSMLITGEENGTGILNITSTTFEGLNSELHLQIDGGYINIVSQDDGINVNEDHVSVFTMNGGRLTIFAGQGAEGDVIDSNGYITVNGGTILGTSPSVSDEILDSEDGNFVSDDATIYVGGAMNMNGKSWQHGMFEFDQRPEMPERFDHRNPEGDFRTEKFGEKPMLEQQ